jgi:hypothetical protein
VVFDCIIGIILESGIVKGGRFLSKVSKAEICVSGAGLGFSDVIGGGLETSQDGGKVELSCPSIVPGRKGEGEDSRCSVKVM